jgi:hypothetical protein
MSLRCGYYLVSTLFNHLSIVPRLALNTLLLGGYVLIWLRWSVFRNIAQVIAAAVATFNDSELFGYEGMNSLQVSREQPRCLCRAIHFPEQ